jgi:hypothetical protein
MSPREAAAFQDVSLYCERDVQVFCEGAPETVDFLLMPPAPSLHELESFIDGMIQSTLRMPSSDSGGFLLIMEETHAAPVSMEDRTMHHVLSEIVQQTPPEKMPCTAKRIADHGNFLLAVKTEDASEPEVRMARRLSEVTPEVLQEHKQSLLPFGADRNACLRNAYSQTHLTVSCGRSIHRLDQIRGSQYEARVQLEADRATVLVNLAALYFLVLATGLVIYGRRRKDIRAKRRLTRDILQAIYSKPYLKKAVETELGGASVGHVPPLPTPVLWRMGFLGRKLKDAFRTYRVIRLTFVMVVATCFVVAPLSTLPFVVSYGFFVFATALLGPKPPEICVCCCCHASTQDAENGTLTVEQECCNCCMGTGVCSVDCASCCTPTGDAETGDYCNKTKGCCGCCCCKSGDKVEGCCGKGCCCCCKSGDKLEGCCCSCCNSGSKIEGWGSAGGACGMKKEESASNLVVYEGVPMQIV